MLVNKQYSALDITAGQGTACIGRHSLHRRTYAGRPANRAGVAIHHNGQRATEHSAHLHGRAGHSLHWPPGPAPPHLRWRTREPSRRRHPPQRPARSSTQRWTSRPGRAQLALAARASTLHLRWQTREPSRRRPSAPHPWMPQYRHAVLKELATSTGRRISLSA